MCEKSWEDLDLTRDEVHRMTEAFKKEEFRKLLLEYADEVNDPANKKLYEEEITQLEKERGVDVTFIHPEPGFVVKTSVDGRKKAYLNICQNENVGKPSCVRCVQSGISGLSWSLPYTQAPPKEDLDKGGKRCTLFDIVFHPDTHQLANSNAEFRNTVIDIAIEAVENNFNVKLDRCNLKLLKYKFKGASRATVIRKKSTTIPAEVDSDLPPFPYPPPFVGNPGISKPKPKRNPPENKKGKLQDNTDSTNSYAIPKYVVTHRSDMDIQNYTLDKMAKLNSTVPKYLVVEIHLPLLKSSKEISLDILDKSILLVSEKPKYKLDLPLPYHLDEDGSRADFDAKSRKLTVTLCVKNRHESVASLVGLEDSGVESNLEQRISNTSVEDDNTPKILVEVQEESVGRTDNEMGSVASDEAYRTSGTENQKPFLIPDIHYSFPTFSCNVDDNVLAFVLHVKNVDPTSIERMDLNSGIHLKFKSVGAGFFPLHYAFLLEFPASSAFPEAVVSVEPWDNNVIVQVQFCLARPVEYSAGVDETALETFRLPSLAMLSHKLKQLELEVDTEPSQEHLQVEVTLSSDAEVVVEVSPNQMKAEDKMYEGRDEGNKSEKSSRDSSPTADTPDKSRTWSESSCEELGSSPTKKGILKLKSRSLSESNADDYTWSSSLDMFTYSESDSCIPEEEELRESKKTVRFNDIVAEKTFRANSSILGQRKKNQRKMRNKKRSNERRASESENSEGEERDKNYLRGEKRSGQNLASSAQSLDGEKNGNINVATSTESLDRQKNVNENVASLTESLDGKKPGNGNMGSQIKSVIERKTEPTKTKKHEGENNESVGKVDSSAESLSEKMTEDRIVGSSTELLDNKKPASGKKKKNRKANFHNNLILDLDM